jgi:mannose-1-phosphate guanylyltransferase
VRRLSPLVPLERVIVVTGQHLAAATARALPGLSPSQILHEPAPRNTAPCIAWANATIARRDPDAIVMVLPSDHFIGDEPGFSNGLALAVKSAERGSVTTVGIVPTRPETGYGYIEVGEPIDGLDGPIRAVRRFVEKPDRARAAAFVEAGPSKYLWNAGMFFFRVRDMTTLMQRHLPAVAAGIARIDAASGRSDSASVVQEVFPTLQSISIDHGVMEKAEGLAVVPGNFGWNDVGSWQSAWELAPHDANGNALGPNDLAIDAKNNLVRSLSANSQGKTIALVGVDDLVVVETDDAILVIPRERAQDAKLVVDRLKQEGRTKLV